MMKYNLFLVIIMVAACRQPHTMVTFPEGGYQYAGKINPGDSNYYFLPVRNLVPHSDTFLYVEGYHFFQCFDEPNLSLGPQPEPVFRLVSSPGYYYPTVIVLKEKEIIVKKGIGGNIYPTEDQSQLTDSERHQYIFLQRYYAYKKPYTKWEQAHIAFMMKLYPRLADPAWYRCLIDKAADKKATPFIYSTKRVPLTPTQYQHLVSVINNSGYWKLPFELPCTNMPMDATGFSLEANTPNSYNYVRYDSCGDSTDLRFKEACGELVKYAGLLR